MESQQSILHKALNTSIYPPFPSNFESIIFGMGCFWGAERLFWQHKGVYTTHVGYSGGSLPNPTHQNVHTGKTGHVEVVRVVYDPNKTIFQELLKLFWDNHDPCKTYRQAGLKGSEYRSVIFVYSEEQTIEALQSRASVQEEMRNKGFGKVYTKIERVKEFYYADRRHQQYLYDRADEICGCGVKK